MSATFDNTPSAPAAETAPAAAPAEISPETAVPAAADSPLGSCSDTLHDFVSNLINDGAAKAAYLADPLAALSSAGLGDITPADVQEVLPLIADSLPSGLPTDLSALPVDLGDLPLDLPAGVPGLDALPVAIPTGDLPTLSEAPMDGGLSGALPAVPGLDALPGLGALPAVPGLDSLPGLDALPGLGALPAVPGLDALPGLGALPAVPGLDSLPGLGALPAVPGLDALPGLGSLPAVPGLGDLPGLGDVTGALPVDVPALPPLSAPVLGDVTAGVSDAAANLGVSGELVDSTTAGFLSTPTFASSTDTVLGDVTTGAHLDPQSQEFGGTGVLDTGISDVKGGLSGDLSGVGGWGGIDTPAADMAVGTQAGLDGVRLAGVSSLGDFSLNVAPSGVDLSITPGDPADLLDVHHLGDTGDAVAGTVAHAVGVSGGVLADNMSGGSDGLGGLLTGTAGTVAGTLDSTTDTVTNGVHTGTGAVVDHASTLPSVGDLQLPQLPQVPDIASTDLSQVTDVAGGHLPSLPVDLPDVGAVTSPVTDLVSHNPVTDVVHSSPVGGAVDGVTDHLHGVTDQLGDLHLGL